MKRLLSTLLLCGFIITGCGGGGGGSSSGDGSSSTVSSGVAVDPYLEGAVFCVDTNDNGVCDTEEPESTASDENGVFTFTDYEVQEGDIILMKEAGNHNGVPYQYAKMIAIYQGGDLIVSPLTTLMAKEITAAQIVTLLDPDGTYGLTEELVSQDPMEIIESIGGDELTNENLAAIRASIGSYMLLRMIDANDALNTLAGEDLVNNADVQALAANMMAVVAEAITVERIAAFQDMIDGYGVDDLPAIDIMDIIYTGVTICEYALDLGEEAFRNTRNINGVINAVNQFKNNDLSTIIEQVGPAQYVYRLKKENKIQGPNGVPFQLQDFVACSQGVHLGGNGRPMCYEDAAEDDVIEAIADAPEIEFDFDPDTYNANAASSSFNSFFAKVPSSDPVGACYVNGVRYNASVYVPDADYLRCVVTKTAEAGYLDGITEGPVYLKLTDTDAVNHFAKLSYADGTATADICYNHDMNAAVDPTEQNVRITVTYDEDGYAVDSTMILDNNWNGTDAGFVEDGLKIQASANVSEEEGEMYSFIIHFLNEQGANCADLPSGSSETGTDNQCFLRYEGNIYYGLGEEGSEYSKYDGLFVEKVSDNSNPAFLAGGSFSAVISDGTAYSRYAGIDGNSFTFGDSSGETWAASTMLLDFANSLDDYFSGITVPARTVTMPAIEDAWDCTAESFVTVNTDEVEEMSECVPEDSFVNFVGAGDLTTCSEGTGSINFQSLMRSYRCNADDPLTLGASADTCNE